MGKTPVQHDTISNPEWRTYFDAIVQSTDIKEKTRYEYRGNLGRIAAKINKPVEAWTYLEIDTTIRGLATTLGTVNNYKSAVKWLFNEYARVILADTDEVKAARFERLAKRFVLASSGDIAARQKSQKMTISYEQYKTLVAACEDDFHQLLLRLLWETIRRPGEVLNIRWQDIDGRNIRFAQTKMEAVGWAKISEALAADLKAWQAKQVSGDATIMTRKGRARPLAPSEFVLTYTGTTPLRVGNVGRWLRNLGARAGIVIPKGKKFSPHCFRGSGAVYLRRTTGWTIEDIQRQGGWANSEVLVKAYFHDEVDTRGTPEKTATGTGTATMTAADVAKLVELGIMTREEARATLGLLGGK